MESPSKHLSLSGVALSAIAMATAATTSTSAGAQETQGVLVVSRDVPERYAFLPGSGEATTVNTAPFMEIWGDIDPGQPIADDAASTMSAKTTGPALGVHALTKDVGAVAHLDASSGVLTQSGNQSSGVGAIVGQTIDNGMTSLRGGLDQIQSAVRPR